MNISWAFDISLITIIMRRRGRARVINKQRYWQLAMIDNMVEVSRQGRPDSYYIGSDCRYILSVPPLFDSQLYTPHKQLHYCYLKPNPKAGSHYTRSDSGKKDKRLFSPVKFFFPPRLQSTSVPYDRRTVRSIYYETYYRSKTIFISKSAEIYTVFMTNIVYIVCICTYTITYLFWIYEFKHLI